MMEDKAMENSTLESDKGYFVFREVQSSDELLELLRLRYNIYRNSRLAIFSKENLEKIDVDVYDAHARHFGYYKLEGNTCTAVGYIRMVDQNWNSSASLMTQLGDSVELVRNVLRKELCAPLPMCSYGPEGNLVAACYEVWLGKGERVVEVGRLCLNPSLRNLEHVRRIAESALALGFFGEYGVNRALFTCNFTHRAFYRRFGFSVIPGTTADYWGIRDTVSCALMATPETIPTSMRMRLHNSAQSFDRAGRISFGPISIAKKSVAVSLTNDARFHVQAVA